MPNLDDIAQRIIEARRRAEQAKAEYDAIMADAKEEAAPYKNVIDEAKATEAELREAAAEEIMSAFKATGDKTHGPFQVRSRRKLVIHNEEAAIRILENQRTEKPLVQKKINKRNAKEWVQAMATAGFPVDTDVMEIEVSHNVAFLANKVDGE